MACAPIRIDGAALTLVLGGGDVPGVVYLGPRLPADEDLDALAAARCAPRHGSQPDVPVPASIFPHDDLSEPALIVRREGRALALQFERAATAVEAHRVALTLRDVRNQLEVTVSLGFGAGDALTASVALANQGGPLGLDRLASLSLPLRTWATHATRFAGRWAGEMRTTTEPIAPGRIEAVSREGRPGFAGAHWLIVHEAGADADRGRMLAFHLGWSGDGGWRIERDADSTQVQLGLVLDASEIVVPSGDRFTTPDAVVYATDAGRNGVRAMAHRHVRQDILPDRAAWPARRVHLNSWEALAFDLDEAGAMALADAAAAIGAERFVLDDGWFAGRTDDRRSLGDWTADPVRFPRGLGPLIAHVEALGLDFGLWVEPEMVSPDSALYRAHPDWCLHVDGIPRATQRHQLVLDLTRPEVVAYLFGAIDTLLRAHPIAYLKWDHNRPLFPRAGKAHAQVVALHALLDRLRAAHPVVEIESCASGGGRIDHAMLRRAHRVWPSDNNDPHDRARIDTAWSLFLPPEIRGLHVGPSPNPITGRRVPMDLRAKLALFGHMGVEANPAAMSEGERAVLTAVIALHKQWRDLLHSGVEREIAREPGGFGRMIMAEDGARALALVAQLDSPADYNAAPVCLTGLAAERRYRVTLPEPWPRRGGALPGPDRWREGLALSGRALAAGITLPLQTPETAWIIALEAVA